MKMCLKLIFSFSLLFFSTPSHARLIQAGNISKTISVYETNRLDQGFEIIGKVTVSAAMPEQLIDQMKKIAQQRGGDAVLLYKVVREGILPSFGTSQVQQNQQVKAGDVQVDSNTSGSGVTVGHQEWPLAQGVIVRFVAKTSTTGLNEITAETPVPVLK